MATLSKTRCRKGWRDVRAPSTKQPNTNNHRTGAKGSIDPRPRKDPGCGSKTAAADVVEIREDDREVGEGNLSLPELDGGVESGVDRKEDSKGGVVGLWGAPPQRPPGSNPNRNCYSEIRAILARARTTAPISVQPSKRMKRSPSNIMRQSSLTKLGSMINTAVNKRAEDFILIAFKRMNPRGNIQFRKRDQELDVDSNNTTDTSETESDDGTYEYEQELFDLAT
ncbi:hypothetical protein HZH68_006684 [Vespula germanica]|uniref:Uncharacterized protein n=1 Tax=Vespula germanica TaxID=30212 RepID=A0A834NBH2_VESGE|nr:hypothetical protein HZH68_006684 [Vespula germanica]